MRRRGVTHKMLCRELAKHGVQLEEQSLVNKLNRRTLTFSFALMVFRLLHIDQIEVPKV